jgi:hypothetical protein
MSSVVPNGYVLQFVEGERTLCRLLLSPVAMQALADAFVVRTDSFTVKNTVKSKKLWEFDGFPTERSFSYSEAESGSFHRALVELCMQDDFADLCIEAEAVDGADLPDILIDVMSFLEAEFGFVRSVYARQMVGIYQEDRRKKRAKDLEVMRSRTIEVLKKEALPLPRPESQLIRDVLDAKSRSVQEWLRAHGPNPVQSENGMYLYHSYKAEILNGLLGLEEGKPFLSPLELIRGALDARLSDLDPHWFILAWATVGQHVNVSLPGIKIISPPQPAMAA